MKKIQTLLLIALSALLFSSNTNEKTTWTLDKNHAKLGLYGYALNGIGC